VTFAEYDIEEGALAVVKDGRLSDGCGKDFVGRVEVMYNGNGQPIFAPLVQKVFIPIFEAAVNPMALTGTIDDDVLKEKGLDVLSLDVDRRARELQVFGNGCDIVCLYRARPVCLPADSATHKGYMIYCQIAMFGVSNCLWVMDERKGLERP